jgi:hypothetical protein
MKAKRPEAVEPADRALSLNEALSPYKADVWTKLTPRERLRRSWELRSRLPNPRQVHDHKLFPKP